MKNLDDRLPDGEIARYLENRADGATQRKIEESAELSQFTTEMGVLTQTLQQLLYRNHCPTTSDLGDFHLGLLSRRETKSIITHLKTCPLCTHELVILQKELGEPLLETSLLDRIKTFIATPLSETQPPRLIPAVRGEEESTRFFTTTNGFQLTLDIQDDVEVAGYNVLIGLVINAPPDLTVHLWQNSTLLKTASINRAGNFMIESLSQGDYELIIQGDQIVIHIQKLTI